MNKHKIRALKVEVKTIQITKKEFASENKKATAQNSIYHRAAKPYLDAKKLLVQAENYKHLDEVMKLYNQAKKRKENTAAL